MRSAGTPVLLSLVLLTASLAGCAGTDEKSGEGGDGSEVADLNQRLNESALLIEDLESRLAALQASADEVPGLETEVSVLRGKVLLLEINITHLNAEIIVLGRLLSDSQNESSRLETELAEAQVQESILEMEIEALQADDDADEDRIEALEELLEAANSTIENLQSQIETYDVIVANLEATRDQLRDRVSELEEQIEGLEASVLELQAQVEELEESQIECDSSTYEDNGICRARGNIWVYMPFENGQQVNVTQSHHGYYSHNDLMLYAVDFPAPENTSIAAALPGVVIQVIEFNTGGCPSIACANQSNLIVIDHGDSTFGMYAHLTHNGALVDVGDTVHQGQPIGLSGNTGWSTGPHLHFEVKDVYGQSLPIRFYELANISDGIAFWSASLTSANVQSGQGLNHTHSLCEDGLFLSFGILLDSDIPCSVALLDTTYSLQGWTYAQSGMVGVAQYDISAEQWLYSCHSSNATGWFDFDLVFSSVYHDYSTYFMIYSADSNCISYQAWDASIGLWLE